MRRGLALGAVLLLSLGAQGPPPPPAPAPPGPVTDGGVEERPDDAPLPVPLPVLADTLHPSAPPPVLDAYRADPDFQYDRPEARGPSLLERFFAWLRRLWSPVADNTSAGFRETIYVLLAVLALGWAVTRLLRVGGTGLWARKDAPVGGAPLLDVEDIAEVDLGPRLRQALAAGDHREAVRVRYLQTLQALDAAGVVAWRRDKTNRQYAAEVGAARRELAAPFRAATRVFDAVWYGERPVSAALYAEVAPLFDRAAPEGRP